MDPFDLREWNGFGFAVGNFNETAIVDQIVIDSRRIDSPNALFVALKGKKEDGHHYVKHAAISGAKFALVSHNWEPTFYYPGLTLLRSHSPLQSLQEIAKTYRLQLPTKIIGVAGSFGKTMVKDLLFSLLGTEKCAGASPESFNSQIGVALSLLTLHKQNEIAVIEAAISHKDEMDILVDLIRPDYTILTPLGKKHLATLQDMHTLVEEIFKLMKATSSKGWSLLLRDPFVEKYCSHFSCSYFFWNEVYRELPHATFLPSHSPSAYQISFPDGHSYQDVMQNGYSYFLNLLNMATKAAWLLGISSSQIISVLQNYQPEPTRSEIWKSSLGTVFINEPYCSDPQSVDQTLCHFGDAAAENRKIFVFGGIRESISSLTDYRRIGKAIAKSNIHRLILVGKKPFQSLIEEILKNSKKTEISTFDSYEETFSNLQHFIKTSDFIIFKGEKKLSFDSLIESFNDGLANNQCFINLAAIQDNLALIRQKLPNETRIMVTVKALAYGTDAIRMAKFLTRFGIDILCVSYVDEGVSLRRAGVEQAIFSINAAPYEIAKVVKWNLEVGVSDENLINALAYEANSSHTCIKVHLHVDTGMGRFGCRPEKVIDLARQIRSFPSLELEGIMTHFASADDPLEDDFTRKQIAIFDQVIQTLKDAGIEVKWSHAANSSGALRFYLPQYNMVRLGLAVYGLYVSEAVKDALDLRLAISLTSRIVGINICKKGETISYGRRYRVEREMQKIAILPIGYFDGLHRNYSGKGHVLIHGKRAPMVGNICMDYMMVDVTDIPSVVVGDKVLIFGEDEFGYYLSPEELANKGDSIIHELITCLGPRIQRIFVHEEGKEIR